MKIAAPLEQRLLERTNKNGPTPAHRPDLGPCWLWIGYINDQGYGVLYESQTKKDIRGHRAWYESTKGPIADGHQLDHLCRVRACVNPNHTEPVTPTVNKLRGKGWTAENARKTHCPEGHPLTEGNLATWHRVHGQRKCLICSRTKANVNGRKRWLLKKTIEALLAA